MISLLSVQMYMSFSPLTGGSISGRLYESLKSHYNIYIESEAGATSVSRNDVLAQSSYLMVILSEGFFNDQQCTENLIIALQQKKPVSQFPLLKSFRL